MTRRCEGLSIAETLAVLILAAALLAALGWWGREPNLGVAARHVSVHVLSARAHSVVHGDSECVPQPSLVAASIVWPPRGLLFTPDGLPRTCDGGGVGNTTILLEHRGRQAAVIVSSLGRVRWELR